MKIQSKRKPMDYGQNLKSEEIWEKYVQQLEKMSKNIIPENKLEDKK